MVSGEVLERLTEAVSASDYDWCDAEDVVALLARDGALENIVSGDEQIKESALAAALKDMAIERSYLIQDPTTEQRFVGPHGPSGGDVGRGRYKYRSKGYDERSLRERYPALR